MGIILPRKDAKKAGRLRPPLEGPHQGTGASGNGRSFQRRDAGCRHHHRSGRRAATAGERRPRALARNRAQCFSVRGGRHPLGDRRLGRRIPAPAVSDAGGSGALGRPSDGLRYLAASRHRDRDPPALRLHARRGVRRDHRRADGALAPGRGHLPAAGEHLRADPRPRLCAAVFALVRARQFLRRAAGRLRGGVPDRLQQLDRREGGEGNLGALGAIHGCRRPPAVQSCDPAGRAALHPDRAAARPGAGLAYSGGGGDARGRALGAGLDDLRRAQVPQHRRHDGGHRRDRHHRSDAGETRVPEDRELHRRALGHDHLMTENGKTIRSIVRAAITLAAAAAVYEALARSGYFAPALLPTIPVILQALYASIADGTMIEHAAFTLYRVMFGFSLAVVVGIPLGILMARFQRIEHFVLPLVSALMPIPSFALVPLFMLWFGIGNLTTILIVFYAATFPMVFNTWSGVRSVNPIWLRAAGAMGADENSLFWNCLLYTSPSPRDRTRSRMPS